MTAQLIRRRPRPASDAAAPEAVQAPAAPVARRRVSLAPARSPAATTPAEPATRTIAVRRFAHANTAAAQAAREQSARVTLEEDLQSIANVEAEIDVLLEKLGGFHKKVEQTLRDSRMSSYSNGVHVAKLEETFSQQRATVDPKRFKAQVTDKDFWECVSVQVGKAKEVLGEKEFFRIADVVPGKSNGIAFTLKAVKKKGK